MPRNSRKPADFIGELQALLRSQYDPGAVERVPRLADVRTAELELAQALTFVRSGCDAAAWECVDRAVARIDRILLTDRSG